MGEEKIIKYPWRKKKRLVQKGDVVSSRKKKEEKRKRVLRPSNHKQNTPVNTNDCGRGEKGGGGGSIGVKRTRKKKIRKKRMVKTRSDST